MALVTLIAPILPHTSEAVWQFLPDEVKTEESVFLTDWPESREDYYDESLMEKWEELLKVRKDVAKALEIARAEKEIGNSLEAMVVLKADNQPQLDLLNSNLDLLADLLIVSQVELDSELADDKIHMGSETGVGVKVHPARGEKCARCWKYSETVGDDKEHEDICDRCSAVVNEESN